MSKRYHPQCDLDAERWEARGLETRYFNTSLHLGAFALPTFVERLLEKGEILDDVFLRTVDERIWPKDNDEDDHDD